VSDQTSAVVHLGQVLGHGFIVGPELGRGGMGAVHAVTPTGAALEFHADLVPKHALVVKCVTMPDAIPRLLAEDRLLAALCHPGFPQHVASGWEAGRGLAWSVRTRIPGVALEPGAAGTSDPATLVAIALSLTAALDHLHRLGYVHGDLAPSNTLWDAEAGLARVLDLGTAVPADSDDGDGTTSGVLAYAAPECLRGQAPTSRSDVWALGALLFGLAHGVHPFPGYPVTSASGPASRPGPAGPLDALLARMLAEDPSKRPGDMEAVREAVVAAALEARLPVPTRVASAARDRLPFHDAHGALHAARSAILEASARGRAVAVSRGEPGRTRWLGELTRTLGLELRRPVFIAAPPDDDPEAMLEALAAQAGLDDTPRPGAARFEALLRSGALIAVDLPPDAPRTRETVARLARRLEASPAAYAPTAIVWTEPDGAETPSPGWTAEDVAALLHACYPRRHALKRSVVPLVEETGGAIPAIAETLLWMAAEGGVRVEATAIELGPLPSLPDGVQTPRTPALSEDARSALAMVAWASFPVNTAALGAGAAELAGAGAVVTRPWARPSSARWRAAGRLALPREEALQRLRSALVAGDDALGALEAGLALGDAEAREEAFRRLSACAPDEKKRLARGIDSGEGTAPTAADALELASALMEAGAHDAARRHLDTLLGLPALDPPLEARACALRAAIGIEHTAYAEAARDATRALEIGGLGPALTVDTALVAARALVLSGRRDEARAETSRCRDLLGADPTLATPLRVARLAWVDGIDAWFGGDLDRAAHHLERGVVAIDAAFDAADRPGDDADPSPVRNALLAERAGLRIAEGLVAHRRGGDVALDRAEQRYKEALADAERAGDMARVLGALQNLGVVMHERGQLLHALDAYRRALTLATALDQPARVAQIAGNLGNLHRYLGDVEEARQVLAMGLEAAERTENLHARLLVLNLLGDLDTDAADLHGARQRYEAALALARRAALVTEEAEIALNLSRVRMRQGERAEAERMLEAGTAAAARGQLTGLAGQLAAARAELARMSGADVPAELMTAMETGFEAATNVDTRWLLAHQLAIASRDRATTADARRWAGEVDDLLRTQRDAVPGALQERFFNRQDRALALRDARAILASGDDTAETRAPASSQEWTRIVEIAKRVASERDVDRLLAYIMDSAVLLSGAERGFLVLAREPGDGEHVEVRLARNLDQENIRQRRDKISRTVVRRVIETAEPALTIDAMEDERYREKESVHAMRLRSILCVPMRIRGVALGAIYVDNRFQSAVFTERDRKTLEALADLSAIALDTARSLQRLEDQRRQLEAAREAVATLNARLERELARREEELEASREALRHEREARAPDDGFAGIIGAAPPMQRLFRLIERLRRADLPVLIEGESGTGKELVARALHFGGPREDRPFVALNCGAIPAGLIESELFGHVRGAFTNAHQDKRGLFEAADGGTLFLDEIGELPLELQVKLLRVLQSGEIQKVGATRQIRVSVRVVAATNRRLEDEIAAHRFREDLFYRLSVVRLELPPLRDRREDIPLLVRHFIDRHRAPEGPTSIDRAALARLVDFDWPGNVRQLETVVRSALVFSEGQILRTADLPNLPSPAPAQSNTATVALTDGPIVPLSELERSAILRALEVFQGNKSKAAKALGIDRRTLYNKLAAWGLGGADG
jgi:serine/threonine-protein kinase PknK